MEKVTVVTDSVAIGPAGTFAALGIAVVPYQVTIGEQGFLDGIDLTPGELYRRMREEKIIPKTSQPSFSMYYEVFRRCLEAGANGLLYVGVTSPLSGAYGTAVKAAELLRTEFPTRRIETFDTRTAAVPQAFIAMEAALLAAQGRGLDEVLNRAREVQRRVGMVLVIDTLYYLALGGRIGKAAGWVGGLLKVKPIITLNEEGTVEPVARVRSRRAALDYLVSYVEQRTAGCRSLKLGIMHADALEEAEKLRGLARERLHPTETFITEFTPVMGAHSGPGVVGLGYFFED